MRQLLSRIIPRRAKVQLRTAYAHARHELRVRSGRADRLLPPPWLHSVGDGEYIDTGDEFFRYFVELAGLQPHEKVLDVGCGTGRMARPLVRYLTSGSYEGIDVVAPSVKWCADTYSTRYPNFGFQHSNVYNKMYNPDGRETAAQYRFPFENDSFDFVFLTSVLTHMLARDMEGYVSEVARVLKSGGRCLITYFLLTPESRSLLQENNTRLTFRYGGPDCQINDQELPEAAVAYDQNRILELYKKHQLAIWEPIRYGTWCGRKSGLSYQDIVLARKEARAI